MNAASFLLPNFNITALIGPLMIIIGVLVLIASAKYASRLKKTQATLQLTGWILIAVGAIYWIFISMIQDIMTDTKMMGIASVGILLVVMGLVMFWPKKKRKK